MNRPEKTLPLLLVVDDSIEDIEILALQLKNSGLGFTLQTCEDAELASRTLAGYTANHDRPALIILDLHLPPTDGESVFRDIRKNPALERTPVLIMTTSASPTELNRFRTQPYTHVITKPFSLNEYTPVINTIRNLLVSQLT